MKTIRGMAGAFILYLLIATAGMAEGSASPAAPTELKLTSGATLRKVTVVRYEGEDRVVIKHLGGMDPVRLSYIAEPGRSQLIAYRAVWTQANAVAKAQPAKNRTIEGQVFITTQGAGAYKFAGATVRAFSLEDLSRARAKLSSNLPSNYPRLYPPDQAEAVAAAWEKSLAGLAELGRTTTDAEGNYRLPISPTKEGAFLACFTVRYRGTRIDRSPLYEHTSWVVELPDSLTRLDLNNLNQWQQPD